MPPDENPAVEDAYDKLSQTYKTQEDDPYCADLEFPAMTGLIPNVEGKRVLDAGCGRGRYAEWLIERGANVVAVDKSSEMVEPARQRIGDRAEIRRADIGKSLNSQTTASSTVSLAVFRSITSKIGDTLSRSLLVSSGRGDSSHFLPTIHLMTTLRSRPRTTSKPNKNA